MHNKHMYKNRNENADDKHAKNREQGVTFIEVFGGVAPEIPQNDVGAAQLVALGTGGHVTSLAVSAGGVQKGAVLFFLESSDQRVDEARFAAMKQHSGSSNKRTRSTPPNAAEQQNIERAVAASIG